MVRRTRAYNLAAVQRITELGDLVIPFAIRAACELRLADLLEAAPLTVAQLAESLSADPIALRRLLRALAAAGVISEIEPELFALTELGQPLRSDHPLSMREAYPLIPADIEAWAHLDHSVLTGQSAFEHVHGVGYWDYMADHESDALRFDGTQRAASRLELRTLLPAFTRWPDARSVVDVGGGNGAFLAGILARFPRLRGTVLDLPHVVAGAPDVFAEAGVADRAAATGGSFFETVPAGADLYLLKRVLYHWSDDEAVRLLGNLAAAMLPSSTLLLLEPIAEPGDALTAGRLYDLILLTMAGGGLRSEPELQSVVRRAGLEIRSIRPTVMFPVIEIGPAR